MNEYVIHEIYNENVLQLIYKKRFRRLLYQLTTKCTFQFNFQFSLQVIFADLRIENGDLRM